MILYTLNTIHTTEIVPVDLNLELILSRVYDVYKSQQYKKYLDVANTIRLRWMGLCENVYNNTHKLLEKYNVVELTDTGGGEYPNQDGFGWTNGVYRAFCDEGSFIENNKK